MGRIFLSFIFAVAILINSPVMVSTAEAGTDNGNSRILQELQDCNNALQQDRTDWKALWYRGTVNEKLHKPYSAMKDYNEAIKTAPDYAAPYASRGELYAKLGKYDEALKDCNTAISISPERAESYISLAYVYGLMHNYGRCAEAYDKAVSLASGNQAEQYRKLRDESLARKASSYKLLYGRYKETDNGLWVRAMQHLRVMDYVAAEDYSRKSIALNKNYVNAYESLGEALFHQGKDKEAIDAFSTGIEICKREGTSPAVLHSMYRCRGGLYMKQGELGMALDDLNESIRLDPAHNEGAFYLRGETYRHMGEYKKAEADYRAAIYGNGYSPLSVQAYYGLEEITPFLK